jgi:hypothetical protein
MTSRWNSWSGIAAAVVTAAVGAAAAAPPKAHYQDPNHQDGARTFTGNLASLPVLFTEGSAGAIQARAADLTAAFEPSRIAFAWRGTRIYLTFPGSREKVEPALESRQAGKVHYLVGDDPSGWRPNVATYAGVIYRDLYPGIDMVYGSASGRSLKSEFAVSPHAAAANIRLRYWGAHHVTIANDGSLRVVTSQGELREEKPFAYQSVNGRRMPVAARFVIDSQDNVGFALGAYDTSQTLWIDPAVSYSSYVSGSRMDYLTGAAVDSAGNLYVSGWTESWNLPAPSPVRSFGGSVDAWVAKVNPSGSGFVWATFIGGSGDDRAYGVDVDPSNNVYVAGYTSSNDFPTQSALQWSRAGGRDAFVVKINAAGSSFAYSTYWGGGGNDAANGIAVDSYGQAYVVGDTDSANFPLRFPFQSSLQGQRDAFVFKIGISGAASFSTLVGGSGDERGMAIAVPDTLTPYIAGCTTSTGFPTHQASQPANGGGQDGFVVRFNGDANGLVYSTYLGGAGGGIGSAECVNAIAIDSFKNAYVTGTTSSTNFPVSGAFQPQHAGGTLDAFVTKLNSDGVRLYSSYLGGRNADLGTGIRVDSTRRAYVVGYTASNNFPSIVPVQTSLAGLYDAFAVRVDTSGTLLNFATYLGGNSSDVATGVAYHPSGALHLVGITTSTTFPLVSPIQTQLNGAAEGFLTKISGVSF